MQSSVVWRANHKLTFKFLGPFTIVQRVGQVSYKLDLPATSRVHPVFHVSQLKKCLGAGQQVLPHLPHLDATHHIPVAVLQRRVRSRGLATVVQVLVQWSGLSAAEDTWEDLDSLQQQFPRSPAWGQAGIQAGENVSGPGPSATPDRERPKRATQPPRWLADHVLD